MIPLGAFGYFLIGLLTNDDYKHSNIFPWLLFYALLCLWTFFYTYLVIVREIRAVVLDTIKNERRWETERESKKEIRIPEGVQTE